MQFKDFYPGQIVDDGTRTGWRVIEVNFNAQTVDVQEVKNPINICKVRRTKDSDFEKWILIENP